MEDKSVQELEFHQDTMGMDGSSPLHLIREKEIEISARLLAAKREADQIVSEARHQATTLIVDAQNEAATLADQCDQTIAVGVERDKEVVGASTAEEIAELEKTIAGRHEAAVAFIVESIVKV